jgi:hypothetical protein
MTSPLMPAVAGGEGGWRFAGACGLVLLAIGLIIAVAARAEELDRFSATVPVDATAETVIKARELARIDGQRRALTAIVERLGGGSAPAKLPKLGDQAITDLVASFEVANERMSAVRYLAEYTYHFRPAAIRQVLENAGIAVVEQTDRPMIVIPVYQAGERSRLWDDPNPWRDSWEHRPGTGSGAARLIMPLGDAGDLAAIDAEKARAGDAEALAAIARRNGGEDAVVALAAIRGEAERPAGLEVTLRRYRAGRLVDSGSKAVTANPGENTEDLMRRAVAAIVSDIGSGWMTEAAAGYDQEGSLMAVLPIASLEDWLRARERLGGVSAIRKLALVALSRQEATIEIGYVGTIDQLKDSLATISLDLVSGEPLWRLARTGP